MPQGFQNGDKVPRAGKYKCGICGDVWDFEVGEEFPECEACYDPNATWESASTDDEDTV